jgi:hypothetical protein
LEDSFGGTKPDMRTLAEVGGLLARFEQYEAENRVEQWERLNVLVQEKLDGLGVSIFFKEQHQPVLNYRPSPHRTRPTLVPLKSGVGEYSRCVRQRSGGQGGR